MRDIKKSPQSRRKRGPTYPTTKQSKGGSRLSPGLRLCFLDSLIGELCPHLQRAFVAEDAERLQLAVQRRAFHADKSRRAGDVAAEPRHLGQEVFALEHLTGVAQWQCHDLAA